MITRRSLLLVVTLTLGLLAAGCGKGTAVTGKLVSKGGPPPPGFKYTVVLTGPAGSYSSEVAADGQFTVQGPHGGVDKGTYEVSVVIYPQGGSRPVPPVERRLPTKVDIGPATPPLTVDLGQAR
ncbi:MAG: hypothetical protein U0736_06645 [Gemmataceae bacterium]